MCISRERQIPGCCNLADTVRCTIVPDTVGRQIRSQMLTEPCPKKRYRFQAPIPGLTSQIGRPLTTPPQFFSAATDFASIYFFCHPLPKISPYEGSHSLYAMPTAKLIPTRKIAMTYLGCYRKLKDKLR